MLHIRLTLAFVLIQILTSTARLICNLTATPPEPRTGCCGRDGSSSKIVGGSATEVDQYPWLVLLEYWIGRDIYLPLCGGSLISGRYVLTAAHCVSGKYGHPARARLGEYDTSQEGPDCVAVAGGGDDCTEGTITIPVETTIPHPMFEYKLPGRQHDIALLRLEKTAPFTYFIRPICLPVTDLTEDFPPTKKLFAAGWGATGTETKSDIKMHVVLPHTSREGCQMAWQSQLYDGQTCAGGEEGKDTCQGDSGGPLMLSTGTHYELVGISSKGPKPCGKRNVPGIYTKVYEYLDWIRNEIES